VLAYHHGNITSRSDPVAYVAAVSALVAKYESLLSEANSVSDGIKGSRAEARRRQRIPLVVNTDGWVKGLGYEILRSVLDTVRPLRAIQIVGTGGGKRFDLSDQWEKGRRVRSVDSVGTVGYALNPAGAGDGGKMEEGHGYYGPQGAAAARSVARGEGALSSSVPSSRCSSPMPPSRSSSAISLPALNAPPEAPAHDESPPAQASDLRSLRLATYLLGGYPQLMKLEEGQSGGSASHGHGVRFARHGLIDPDCIIAETLARMRPYAVGFDAVRCHVPGLERDMARPGNEEELSEAAAAALNGSVIGLCAADPDGASRWSASPENGTPRADRGADDGSHAGPPRVRLLPSLPTTGRPPLLPCLGLAVIRSIDRINGVYYLLTPVPPRLLSRANVFLKGDPGVPLPVECRFRGVRSECCGVPYMSCDGERLAGVGVGGDVMRSKNAGSQAAGRGGGGRRR